MPPQLQTLLILAFCVFISACATRTIEPYVPPEPAFAMSAAPEGPFAEIESQMRAAHGPDASGFALLDRNEDGLRWWLALLDSANQSIDVQYYLWYGDSAGRIMAKRLLDAADRGVRVRMLVDDLNTLISDASTVALRDEVAAWLDAHPNIELRLFNPWSRREIAGRLGESITNLKRVNQRMHNKAIIVDNRATILGGRNVGDEYVGLSAHFNFHDLDVLGVGPVARQTSEIFDRYWNSPWVVPASALALPISTTEQSAGRAELIERLNDTDALARFPIAPQSWSAELSALQDNLHVGTSRVYADRPTADAIEHVMLERIHDMLGEARQEVLIVNAYIIPSDRGITVLRELEDRGVRIKILTNSLASHDVPAVNSHYKRWRRPILEAGAELYELRHDAEIQALVCDTPPTRAEFTGLHSKAMVVDRERVYIGSMNYDPRSAHTNTEMGAFIESPDLATALARLIERDMQRVNSWQVQLDGDGGLRWVNDEAVVTRQPARSWWQRVEDVIFMAFPKDLY
jgi:putative cardiolipin synthase